jgi:hypothetical protein
LNSCRTDLQTWSGQYYYQWSYKRGHWENLEIKLTPLPCLRRVNKLATSSILAIEEDNWNQSIMVEELEVSAHRPFTHAEVYEYTHYCSRQSESRSREQRGKVFLAWPLQPVRFLSASWKNDLRYSAKDSYELSQKIKFRCQERYVRNRCSPFDFLRIENIAKISYATYQFIGAG